MKTLIATLCLVSTVVWAQNMPQPPRTYRPPPQVVNPADKASQSEVLADNYLITLAISDKDKQVTEISLVSATTNFSMTTGAPRITFSGVIAPDDQGGALVRYGLGINILVYEGNNVRDQDSTVQASVRVRLGEPVQILKSGTQVFTLTVARLPGEAKKQK